MLCPCKKYFFSLLKPTNQRAHIFSIKFVTNHVALFLFLFPAKTLVHMQWSYKKNISGDLSFFLVFWYVYECFSPCFECRIKK